MEPRLGPPHVVQAIQLWINALHGGDLTTLAKQAWADRSLVVDGLGMDAPGVSWSRGGPSPVVAGARRTRYRSVPRGVRAPRRGPRSDNRTVSGPVVRQPGRIRPARGAPGLMKKSPSSRPNCTKLISCPALTAGGVQSPAYPALVGHPVIIERVARRRAPSAAPDPRHTARRSVGRRESTGTWVVPEAEEAPVARRPGDRLLVRCAG